MAVPMYDVYSQLAYAAKSQRRRNGLSSVGRIAMRDHNLLTLRENEISRQGRGEYGRKCTSLFEIIISEVYA